MPEMTAEDIRVDERILRDTRHEEYAIQRAKKKTPTEAWRIAFDKPANKSVTWSVIKRLEADPSVAKRVIELRKAIANKVIQHVALNEAYVIDAIKDLIEKSSGTVPVLDADGNEIGRKLADSAGYAKGIDMAAKTLGLYREKRQASDVENAEMGELIQMARRTDGDIASYIEEYVPDVG